MCVLWLAGLLGVVSAAGCGGAESRIGNHGQGASAGTGGKKAAANGGSGGNGFGNSDASMMEVIGSADAAIDGGTADNPLCGHTSIDTTFEKTEVPGNILAVYDKSGSMKDPWPLPPSACPTDPAMCNSSKLIAAGYAFTQAIVPNAAKVNVGTIFFPSDSNCGVAALNSGSQIDMMPGDAYLNAWNVYWNGKGPSGSTPLKAALDAADATLSGTTFTGTTVVVVITDGDPTCNWDDANDPAYVNGLAAKWLTNGVKTYVIGLPGTGTTGQMILNDLAVAGGTTQFFNTTDSQALQDQIAMIASETVTMQLDSCKIALDPPPPDADKVVMVAVENGKKLSVPRDLGPNAGWTINSTGTQVELTGLLCRDAKAGRFSKITFEYGCVDLPPIPPPKPT